MPAAAARDGRPSTTVVESKTRLPTGFLPPSSPSQLLFAFQASIATAEAIHAEAFTLDILAMSSRASTEMCSLLLVPVTVRATSLTAICTAL
jgi:hypothetical protein